MHVPLIDLRAQYQTLKPELDDAVARVIESQYFVMGPEVEGLEGELAQRLGVPHAIGCASGTDALLLPLKALNAEPGDEVIIPAFTFFATAGAVWNAGLRPVFADVDPNTYNLTADTVAPHLSDRTRAIIPVHLYGQMAPVDEIMALVAGRDVVVIEDAAQSIGAARRRADGSWVQAGAAGFAGCFSFFPTKNLGSFGEGGLVSTRDSEFAERVAKLRVHGGRQMYHHEMVGTNSRLHALQAAVLRTKLERLDDWNEGRRQNAERYAEGLADVAEVIPPHTDAANRHVYNLYTIRARRRDELKAHLATNGVGSGVYYPVALHLQECFAELGGTRGMLPAAEGLCEQVLSIPIFPELTTAQIDHVIETIRDFYGT